jgi:membrane-bound lytic murein transglycosylase F
MKNSIIKATLLIFIFISSGISVENSHDLRIALDDLDIIKQKGKIVVLTDFNSTNYFIYRGQPMGYQYELLQNLADYLDVEVEVVVSNDLENSFKRLENGDVDLIAANLTVTKRRKKFLDFTEPHSQTRQVLVQRKPDNWRAIDKKTLESALIREQLDLAGKTVYVQKNSAHAYRLHNLSNEIGDDINIIEVDQEAEQLISLVASGDIDYTISDENVAQVNQYYYQNIDIETPVSFYQNMAWAVRKNSGKLLTEINDWMSHFKNTGEYKNIYAKYFKNQRSAQIVESDYYALTSGRISAYDDIIKTYSEEIGWDWRLVASLIYQESRFKPDVKSWTGAFGLMQLMPSTARRFGINSNSSQELQIRAGIRFLEWLDKRFEDVDNPQEKIKFTIASYNVGLGHILDARNLAQKNGSNPNVWENSVDRYLLSKSDPLYYNDPVVKYGYCRGTETYRYVKDIMERYEHYKNLVSN